MRGFAPRPIKGLRPLKSQNKYFFYSLNPGQPPGIFVIQSFSRLFITLI